MPKSPNKPSNSTGEQRYYLRSANRQVSQNGKAVPASKDKVSLESQREERQKLVLWRHPITTFRYFFMELFYLGYETCAQLAPFWPQIMVMGSTVFTFTLAYHYLEFADHYFFVYLRQRISWCLWWIFLGVLSSVGLGTGLHTFVLYLGPHIARVTLAAYECSTTDFPEPPYPDDVICPEAVGETRVENVTIWLIMSKVRLEAVMWGLGTAIGELPPYFVARAARLSSEQHLESEDDDENKTEEEIRELKTLLESKPEELPFADRIKLYIHLLIKRVGFWGILACASIPNPLFDLAGITCGHFLVPFITFFGATAIGKAIIKMHIQQIFVIFLFSAHHVETLLNLVGRIPGGIGETIEQPFKDYLDKQRAHLHTGGQQGGQSGNSLLGSVFGGLVTVMLLYFVVSIVNSLAQSYHSRLCKKDRHHQ